MKTAKYMLNSFALTARTLGVAKAVVASRPSSESRSSVRSGKVTAFGVASQASDCVVPASTPCPLRWVLGGDSMIGSS